LQLILLMKHFNLFTALLFAVLLFSCKPKEAAETITHSEEIFTTTDTVVESIDTIESTPFYYAFADTVPENLAIKKYYVYIDSLVCKYQQFLNYPISEHIIVRANPWIIDTLAALDYYLAKQQGRSILRQDTFTILKKGDLILIPDSAAAAAIEDTLLNTLIDLNLPEFKLRIYEFEKLKFEFSVRIGRNEKKYLALAKREVDLKTPIGKGKIVRVAIDPYYINPTTGKRYYQTRRDDDVYTKMPVIPWIEPEINGIRYGSLIHPTTNETTLGKAYSSGCVGTKEADAWHIYYHAPIGTKVISRYDLITFTAEGDTVYHADVYNLKKPQK
jgi:hypothetical protein